MQALACGYYFFYLTLFAALWLTCFSLRRLTVREAAGLGLAWAAAGALLAPVLLGYRSIQSAYGFKRSPVEILNYSADVAGLWSAAPDSLLWRSLHGASVSSESEQFPGVTIAVLLALAAVMAWKRRVNRSAVAFYAGTSLVMWLLSLGPSPRLHGIPLGVPGPYAVLAALPGFDGMRVPARFWMVAVVCLSACAALACAGLRSRGARTAAVAIATCGLLLDGWPRAMPLFTVPPMRVTQSRARARLQLPMRQSETEAMYGAIAQDRPVFNGYSGYAAPQHAALLDMLEAHDTRILDRLAARDPVEVIIEWTNDAQGQWRGWLDSYGAIRAGGGEGWTAYDILASGSVAPAFPTGSRIPIAKVTASINERDIGAVLDDDLDSRWHAASQEIDQTITADLGAAHHVSAVVMCLGAYPSQYPRDLRAEVSSDGTSWRPAAAGNTVLATYDGALHSPREVPVVIPIDRDGVRFIRLREMAADPHGWSIVELRVIQ
jgi:hypothetical protein